MLEWTGERYVPGVAGDVEIEHLHRYWAVADLVTGLDVLDIACGEGYGAHIMADTAAKVVGVDLDAAAVAHARATYGGPTLRFEQGSCTAIPLPDASVDAVVSFETLEHVDAHEKTLREFARVLKPGGWLCVSCPDRLEYSDLPRFANAFHRRELYPPEFEDLLRRHFAHVRLYGQRIQYASVLGPLGRSEATFRAFRQADGAPVRSAGVLRPVYMIGVASNAPCPDLPSGCFEPVEAPFVGDLRRFNDALTAERIAAETTSQQLNAALAESEAARAGARRDAERTAELTGVLDACRADLQREVGRTTELICWLEQRDAELAGVQARVAVAEANAARDARESAAVRELLDEREADLAAARQALREQVQGQQTTSDRLAECELRLAELSAQCAVARQAVDERDAALVAARTQRDELQEERRLERADFARDREELLAELTAERNDRRRALSHAAAIEAEVAALRASRSWRFTAPLRAVTGALRHLRRAAAPRRRMLAAARAVYRRLPLPPKTRLRLRNELFARFPAWFAQTPAYRGWLVQNANSVAVGATTAIDQHGESAGAPPSAPGDTQITPPRTALSPQPLRQADGTWEWADHETLRARLEAAELARRAALRIEPLPILDFSPDRLDEEIAALRFPAAPEPLVSILIPVYNNLKYTVECLASVAACAGELSFEVVVADDASSDDSPQRLARVPNLRILSGADNAGFLRNVNRALPALRGRYVVLLNNDVQVTPGWLDALVGVAASDPGIGAVGPKIVYPSGHLQEAGCALRADCTAEMIGLGDAPERARYAYPRRVDYCSGACLLLPLAVLRDLEGFDEGFAPAYCEDSDLCLRLRQSGLAVMYSPTALVVHHLSRTIAAQDDRGKQALIARNLQRLATKWQESIDAAFSVRTIAFYLPQYHPIPENDRWWGRGFTEWRNVSRATPNFVGHDQPRLPADLGYYDLRVPEVMEAQAELARRYGIAAFCYYYYWFGGRRVLEMPLERMLRTGRPDFPFCLCWANENWTRRWDGGNREVLLAQAHSDEDDDAVIRDLIRYLRLPQYLRVNGRPLLIVYRGDLFPQFARTAERWRRVCRAEGVGEIYLAMVESFELVHSHTPPSRFGCDAAIEFPPQGLAQTRPPSGEVLNPYFAGTTADYRDLVMRYCTRDDVPYIRFRGLVPGWDNTARQQNAGFCFEGATPGAFQAWAEHVFAETRTLRAGDERLVFVNAWNEWAEGAYLEPDRRFGHAFLEALRNAADAAELLRGGRYAD